MTTPFLDKVYLKEDDHTYHHRETGLQYLSVSALKNAFKKAFNSKQVAPQTARKELVLAGNANPTQQQITIQTQLVLKKWEKNRTDSADHGTDIHKALELYFKTTKIEREDLRPCIKAVAKLLSHYYMHFDEVIMYSDQYRTAGTADKPCFRTASNKSIIDIYDYKTYLKKGVQYHSEYSEFFFPPIKHLEVCNFNETALQLSIYALMLEEQGFKIGRLGMIFIPPEAIDQPRIIPVNYMRADALAVLKEGPRILNEILNDDADSDDF